MGRASAREVKVLRAVPARAVPEAGAARILKLSWSPLFPGAEYLAWRRVRIAGKKS